MRRAAARRSAERLRFQPIADALAILPADNLILDGEAVVADTRGAPDLGLLHADLAAGWRQIENGIPSGRLHDGAASGQRPLRLRAMLWRVRRQLGRCRGYNQRCLRAMQEEEPELNPGAGPVSSRKAP